ncbi:MAG TPA: hypothetical protein VF311_14530, partial [Terriglobales bacterium]
TPEGIEILVEIMNAGRRDGLKLLFGTSNFAAAAKDWPAERTIPPPKDFFVGSQYLKYDPMEWKGAAERTEAC